jgi:DNA-binding transcriptional LysR family regulator
MDRLQSMRAFAKVVEQGGFARAARAMDVSDTVVTRLVADLEAHLGTRLLNRTTRKLSLTETGQAYLQRVLQILQDVDDADGIATSMSGQPGGTLRLYAHIGFGQTQLSQLLPRFANANPAIALDVTYTERAPDLVEEGFDIGIFVGLIQQFDSSMIARQLGVAEALLFASPGYVKKRGKPKTPQDLSSHECLNYPFEPLRQHWSLQNEEGVTDVPITSRIVSSSGYLLRDLALADMGIFILPTFAVSDYLSSGRLVRILPGHHLGKLPITMVYPSRRFLSAKVRAFVDFMTAQYPDPEADPWLIS